MARKFKTTWQHPRSKHWHVLDYVITRQRDVSEVHITRAMRGTGCWSDHRMLRTVLSLNVMRPRRCQATRRRKLDVAKLRSDDYQEQLQSRLAAELHQEDQLSPSTGAEEMWTRLKDVTFKVASEVLGHSTTKHKDWFDDQDAEASALLDDMHRTHLAWIKDKSSSIKKKEYVHSRSRAQTKLREMKNRWWQTKSEELQSAANRHDLKAFYQGLKAVYGPRETGAIPVRSKDGTMLTDQAKIRERWAEHFQAVLNQHSDFDDSVLDELPQWPTANHLDEAPTDEEVRRAVNQMSTGKAPGIDGIPAEILKHGGEELLQQLTNLFTQIWNENSVPQDFKDALIVHIYKRKGDRACCDNHRGISLLSIAGKVLARILLNRLKYHVDTSTIIPESQCGFRAGRGVADMIFAARQMQEKCREQHRDLYMVFIDLTKAFDSVNRRGLWLILHKIGCPDKFISIIRSFHEDMKGQVIDSGVLTDFFGISNGTKQGCVLAPLLFSIFFAMMLLVAFRNSDIGIPIHSRADGSVFNLRRLQARTKTVPSLVRDLLYADDCALLAHTLHDAQHLFDRFRTAAVRFGLTVSLKKTEVMYQALSSSTSAAPVVRADDITLKAVDHFCYLGSILSADANADMDISARIAKASSSFGRLSKRLWDDHGIRLDTKVAVYKAVVLSVLLFGCESWTLYRRHIRKLDQFHMRCLRQIAHIKWQDKIPNTEVLQRCHITGIEAFLLTAQLRWTGHVTRMDHHRLPRVIFYGQLQQGERSRGGQRKRYKDALKVNLNTMGIKPADLEELAADRTTWRATCQQAVVNFEESRVRHLEDKRRQRKTGQVNTSASSDLQCDVCGRICGSKIGLFSHRRTHP